MLVHPFISWMLHQIFITLFFLGSIQADESFLANLVRDAELHYSSYGLSAPHNQGCGPNPLLALVTEMPLWLQESLTASSTGEMMRSIRSDGTALREFLHFKRMLRRFKDCIKTGDGVRAKKAELKTTPLHQEEKTLAQKILSICG